MCHGPVITVDAKMSGSSKHVLKEFTVQSRVFKFQQLIRIILRSSSKIFAPKLHPIPISRNFLGVGAKHQSALKYSRGF